MSTRQFLEQLRPDGPWVITAIVPDGDTKTQTFRKISDALRFIERQNEQGKNVYYQANPTKGAVAKKAAKAEIARVEYLHVDADPDENESPGDFKARMMPLIKDFDAQPTFIVDSGNGLQLLWRLEPIEIEGPGDIEAAEDCNKALALKCGASPTTRNIDRLLRVPGTTNYPNEKKRRLGRIKCPAKVIKYNDKAYALSDFETEAAKPSEKDKSPSGLFHKAVCDLAERGKSIDQIVEHIERYPKRFAATSAQKYKEQDRLRKMVEACCNKSKAATAPPRPAPRIQSLADFVRGFVPPDYLVHGILHRGFLYSLTGRTGSGKTAVMLRLSAMVAGLGKSLGDTEIEQGRVLYFAGENPDDVRMRVIAMCEATKKEPRDLNMYILEGRTSIENDIDRIRERVLQIGGVSLVVVDTMRAYFDGENENDNVQMGQFARTLRDKLTTLPGKPCVVVLCHPTKAATNDNLQPAGGGAFIAEVDGNLTCTTEDLIATIHWQGKIRGQDFNPLIFEIAVKSPDKLRDSKGRQITSVVARPLSEEDYQRRVQSAQRDEDRVWQALRDDPDASMAEIATKLGWLIHKGENKGQPYKAKVQRIFERLKHAGLIAQSRDRKYHALDASKRPAA